MSSVVVCVVFFQPKKGDIEFWCSLARLWRNCIFYFYDNSATSSDYSFSDHKNICYIFLGDNIGLSKAYNLALNNCRAEDILITFDQDSRPNKDYYNVVKDIFSKRKNVGVVGTSIGVHSKNNNCEVEVVDFVISSGSAFCVSILKGIGGFDEFYFIDRVDLDICTNIR